jgi:hypothetical protein
LSQNSALISGAPSRSGSEPDGHFFAGIAQLVEQLICNQQVVGSNPTVGSTISLINQFLTVEMVERADLVSGSLGHYLHAFLLQPSGFEAC